MDSCLIHIHTVKIKKNLFPDCTNIADHILKNTFLYGEKDCKMNASCIYLLNYDFMCSKSYAFSLIRVNRSENMMNAPEEERLTPYSLNSTQAQ